MIKLLSVIVFFALCTSLKAQIENSGIRELRLLSEYVVPNDKQFNKTKVGGLSGIDYDPVHDEYYLISDDRSALNPARFYKAKIHFTEKGIDSVQFLEVHYLLQADGKTYPSTKQNPFLTPDPESIRYNPKLNKLIWSSEGERTIKGKDSILVDPGITWIDTNGKFVKAMNMPSNLVMTWKQKGPRRNGTLEGISFRSDFTKIYASVEEPLYEDGLQVGLEKNTTPIRILEFDAATEKNTAQYAYIPDPVAFPSIPESAFKINGVPEILSIEKNLLLVIERSFSTGREGCTIKIFLTDLSKSDNVMSVSSLKEHPPTHPLEKKLLLNMDDLGIYIDNVEGVTWGHDLPNGHKTLIFMADNNFESFEKTQFFLFEVIP